MIDLTPEELGWVLFACRATRKKDQKSAARFAHRLDPESSIAVRVRVGATAHEKLRDHAKTLIQWSATEIVGIGIDNPERVRKTKDGKTVLMPTTFTIKSTVTITKEDLLNDDPVWPFVTRPSEVAEEITKIEDKRILATSLQSEAGGDE